MGNKVVKKEEAVKEVAFIEFVPKIRSSIKGKMKSNKTRTSIIFGRSNRKHATHTEALHYQKQCIKVLIL